MYILFTNQRRILFLTVFVLTLLCTLSANAQDSEGTETIVQYDTVMTFDPDNGKEEKKIVKTEVVALLSPQFMPVFRSCKTAKVEERNSCTKEKLAIFLDSNLIYPAELRENKIFETVNVRFVVTDDGMVSHVSVVKPGNPYLDAQAINAIEFLNRVFEESPFYPGKSNGENVNVKMVLPVKFTANTK